MTPKPSSPPLVKTPSGFVGRLIGPTRSGDYGVVSTDGIIEYFVTTWQVRCGVCGAWKPRDQSCLCFDNNCQ